MYEKLSQILSQLLYGDLSCLNPNNIVEVSNEAVRIINKPVLDEYDKMCSDIIISISQIVYNNTDRSLLFLDDGVYDLLLEKYREYNSQVLVGAPVIKFDSENAGIHEEDLVQGMTFLEQPQEFINNSFYYEDLRKSPPIDSRLFIDADRNSGRVIGKKNVTVPHMYPKLVGTLDKCKFTLDREALERGVYDDSNVKIFERDFLAKHLQMGLIDLNTPFELVAELKYDGVSVEADVTDEILSARSRGDTAADVAADLSEIFAGYKFPYAVPIPKEEAFGMKFEAIISYINLDKLGRLKGKYYKNSRNGIIGLLGSSDAYDYRDLITLVPLATSIEGIDRVTEIEFLNKYYHSGEYLRYSILRGNYHQILYQVYKFVKEAEYMRNMLPFMYDGVVISYRDPKIIEALGRKNHTNKYSMAIKFNPLVREAVFTGYSYTIGQDGTITPIIHHTPVEFLGTIHLKSSGHSYKRFLELGLAIGDIIQIEYTNDVMAYITKPDVESNFNNPNSLEMFPTKCPCCGTDLIFNESGKTVTCPNMYCFERTIARMTNMMSKLNLKDFGAETFKTLGTTSLTQLLNYSYDDVKILGPLTAEKLLMRINEFKTTPIYDYKIMGSIGFTGIAIESWRKILNAIPFFEIIKSNDNRLYNLLEGIKGVGEKTIKTILEERNFFFEDLNTIANLPNIIQSYGVKQGKTIRFTGCRPDEELYNYLTSQGCDARDAGVTKNTDVLVVPYIGFTSSKTSKTGPNTIVVDINTFRANVNNYIL